MISETEQWLLSGDCSKCRKNKYCSKICKKQSVRTKRFVANLITSELDKRTNRAFSSVMNTFSRNEE